MQLNTCDTLSGPSLNGVRRPDIRHKISLASAYLFVSSTDACFQFPSSSFCIVANKLTILVVQELLIYLQYAHVAITRLCIFLTPL